VLASLMPDTDAQLRANRGGRMPAEFIELLQLLDAGARRHRGEAPLETDPACDVASVPAGSGPLTEMTKLKGGLQDLAAAAARVRDLAAEHDRRQRDLVDRASALGAGELRPSGRPRQASADVAVTGMAAGMVVTAGNVQLAAVGTRAESAIAAAVRGKPAEGIALMQHAIARQNHDRAPHYVIDVRSGTIIPAESLPDAHVAGGNGLSAPLRTRL